MEEVKQGTIRRVRGDVRTLALSAHHHVALRQPIQRLAHRALADPELRGQPRFRWQQPPGAPVPAGEALDEQILNLRIQRPEIWRPLGIAHYSSIQRTCHVIPGYHLCYLI